MDNEIQAYSKTTVGFVTQQYMLNKDGKYICIEQFFTASDEVSRENQNGDPVDIDTSKEEYQPMDMEQPKSDTFADWYQDNKYNDSVQQIYRGIIEQNPDYPLTFMNWCKTKYYPECIDID